MLPNIKETSKTDPLYSKFLHHLKKQQFTGDITTRFSERLLVSTDSSIYQVLPQAVVFPKSHDDVVKIFNLAKNVEYRAIHFSPKGGGTGILGQTLTTGIIIDCSRYFKKLITLNVEEGWVRVQPGMSLEALNTSVAKEDLFFAPMVTSADRATLGGMVNTDAAGIGSCIYGKTSNHILSIKAVLIDGTEHEFCSVNAAELKKLQSRQDIIGHIYQEIDRIITENQTEIDLRFPDTVRFLTGYNLKKVRQKNNDFDLNYLLAGAEGTLLFITEIKLQLTKIPHHRALFVLHYSDFQDALASASKMLLLDPSIIETIGDKVMKPIESDAIFHTTQPFLENKKTKKIANSLNLMEFRDYSDENLKRRVEKATVYLNQHALSDSFIVLENTTDIALLWKLRQHALGLLNCLPGNRRPVGFVEDSVVPIENLSAYVKDITTLFDRYGVTYGAYGHSDAGCLHIRPLLDLSDPKDEKIMQELYMHCFKLVEKYNGVLWGEHGRGFRSELGIKHFGEQIYSAFQQVKAAFDPDNRLNRGKLATAANTNESLVTLYGPLRGQWDRQIPAEVRHAEFPSVMRCDGNGTCFTYRLDTVMCPSEKAMNNRLYSPKGRATLMREWLRVLSNKKYDISELAKNVTAHSTHWFVRLWHSALKKLGQYDYSHEVQESLSHCLECKACASECPAKVNVPEFKAKFLSHYYTRYLRPLKHYVIAHMESIAPWQAKFPLLSSALLGNPLSRFLMRLIGLVDLPLPSQTSLEAALKKRGAKIADYKMLSALSVSDRKNTVLLLQDVVTAFYDVDVVLAVYDFLIKQHCHVYVMSFIPSGKPLHSQGYLKQFKKIVQRNVTVLNAIATLDIAMIGIDPALTLVFRDEYPRFSDEPIKFNVQLIQEWLCERYHLMTHEIPVLTNSSATYYLLPHCIEKNSLSDSPLQWKAVFHHLGIQLEILNVGCCGMAGSYGYEVSHKKYSEKLFQMSWQRYMNAENKERPFMLCTGYSCRSQTQRIEKIKPLHPVQALLQIQFPDIL